MGTLNKYLAFGGGTCQVEVPSHAALNLPANNYGIAFWVRHRVLEGHILTKLGDYDLGYDFFWNNGVFRYDGRGRVSELVLGDTLGIDLALPTLGVWEHYAVSIDLDGIATAYKNGVATGTAFLGYQAFSTTVNLRIGVAVEGDIDDVRIYKTHLTVEEVQAIYNDGRGTKYTGAAAEGGAASAVWEMDEGAGTTITDAVGGLVGTFSEAGVTWADGGTPFTPAVRSHARRILIK